MQRVNIFTFLLVIFMVCGFFIETAFGQEEEYVDAPVGQPAQQAAGGDEPGAAASTYIDQFSSGMINYGFTESLYYQFTGNSIFEDGTFPAALLTNVTWNHFVPLEYKYLPAYSYGAELQYFSATSNDVYTGDDEVVIGPSVNMNLFQASFFIKAYFMDPLKEFLHPFFGFGWGLLSGNFDSTKVGGSQSTTTFIGPLSYRTFGTEVRLSERGGLMMELRTLTASAVTSNDPFDQSDEDDVSLDFSGVQVALTGYFRF